MKDVYDILKHWWLHMKEFQRAKGYIKYIQKLMGKYEINPKLFSQIIIPSNLKIMVQEITTQHQTEYSLKKKRMQWIMKIYFTCTLLYVYH